jgi:hypothetical protein
LNVAAGRCEAAIAAAGPIAIVIEIAADVTLAPLSPLT